MNFTSSYRICHGRETHHTEWGAGNAETWIAWHGLARTGRKMDDIAAHPSSRYRVICPDTIGRGLWEWSSAPEQEYCPAFYARTAESLADQLGLTTFHWLGTSMGGALGTHLVAGWCSTTSVPGWRNPPSSASSPGATTEADLSAAADNNPCQDRFPASRSR